MPDSPQNILVTGGTGFIGSHLCRKLREQGYDVIVLTRNMDKARNSFSSDVTLVETFDSIPINTRINAIIGLAGEAVAQRWTTASRKRMMDSRLEDIRGAYHLIQRLKHKPEVYIRASAIGWYGTDANLVFDESSHPAASAKDSFAAAICAALEKETETIAMLGVRACNLRIGLVLGKEDGPLRQMLLPFSCGLGGQIGDGKQ